MREIIRVEKIRRKDGFWRPIYIVKCATCNNELRIRSQALNTNTQLRCLKCQNRKRPYESQYNTFKKTCKDIGRFLELTFEDFLEMTKIDRCHYCGDKIDWQPYGVVDGEYTSRGYHLDRKDSNRDYYKDNVVVCCKRCNFGKRDFFSYDEWFEMTRVLRANRLGQYIPQIRGEFVEGHFIHVDES